jgi:hypothetical protein
VSGALDVRGLEKLATVSKALKAAPKEMKRELYKEMNSITKDLREEMRAEIPNALPRRGGLAARAQQRASFTGSARANGASIRVRGRKGIDARTLDSGRVRKPLFGNRKHWYEQTAGVRAGALTRVFANGKGHLVKELDAALDRLAEKIARASK